MQDSEDYYVVFEGSDEDDEGVSSDDEEDESFWGELYKFQNPKKSKQRQDADDFELEMNQELSVTMKQLQGTTQLAIGDASTSGTAKVSQGVLTENKEKEFYNDAYFDSDSSSDEEGGKTTDADGKKSRKRHPVMSNDDLFYDPDMDTEDQKWVDARRRYNSATSSAIAELAAVAAGDMGPSNTQRARKPKLKPLPSSDAVLNCPACMCTLCRDCQRHSTYKGQYRAMFVENCEIDTSQSLSYPSSKQKRFKKKEIDSSSHQAGPSEDLFHPVKCAECKTEVAVYDKDEVYHFHNVLSSFT